ncbi:MAG: S24 family peptidase, partial [Atribacterota bacterium]
REPDVASLLKNVHSLDVEKRELFLVTGILNRDIFTLDEDDVAIPVLSSKIPCGVAENDFDTYTVGYEVFKKSLIQMKTGNAFNNGLRLYIVRAKGDSMVGKGIVENDLVIFSPDLQVNSGDVAVVEVEDVGLCIKEVIFQSSAVILKSSNPNYDPIVLIDKPACIIGKVIMHVGYH